MTEGGNLSLEMQRSSGCRCAVCRGSASLPTAEGTAEAHRAVAGSSDVLSLHKVAEVFVAVCCREDKAKLIKGADEQGRMGNRLFPWSALHTEHHNFLVVLRVYCCPRLAPCLPLCLPMASTKFELEADSYSCIPWGILSQEVLSESTPFRLFTVCSVNADVGAVGMGAGRGRDVFVIMEGLGYAGKAVVKSRCELHCWDGCLLALSSWSLFHGWIF